MFTYDRFMNENKILSKEHTPHCLRDALNFFCFFIDLNGGRAVNSLHTRMVSHQGSNPCSGQAFFAGGPSLYGFGLEDSVL